VLNLDETIVFQKNYESQGDYFIKAICYTVSAIPFLDIVRSQLSEIELLQLVPGFYLLLVFLSFLILFFASAFLVGLPTTIDVKKDGGTKTTIKIQIRVTSRQSIAFLYSTLCVTFNNIIPLSLDSFDFYNEELSKEIWSFGQVVEIEGTLVSFLSFLSQFPVLIIGYLTTEKSLNRLPQVWRLIVLWSTFLSGILTPTVDGFTQFFFSISTTSLYLMIINIIEKRVNIKFIGFNSINS
jgi:hypothetical protein